MHVKRRYIGRPAPPFNASLVKGGVQVTVCRAFVEFILQDSKAMKVLDWIKETLHPDEAYMQILNYNHQFKAAGAYLGDPNDSKPTMNRFVVWTFESGSVCHGVARHSICVFGVRDLPRFVPRPELFLNKVMLEIQPLTYDCLEEWHFAKIRDEYNGRRRFDSSYYANLLFARHHRTATFHSNYRVR